MKYEDINTPEELLKYMDNITYGFISNEGKIYTEPDSDEYKKNWYIKGIVQDGEGVINSHIGTCYDQVELERKWFDEHFYSYKTYFIWYEHDTDKSLPTHTFLVYKKDNKYYWFEHSFKSNKGIHEFYNLNDLFNTVYEEQNKYMGDNKYNNCIRRIEYTKPNKNISIEEYLDHILQ